MNLAAKREARRIETVKACKWLADSMQRELNEIDAALHGIMGGQHGIMGGQQGIAETQHGIAAGFKSIDARLTELEKARGMHG